MDINTQDSQNKTLLHHVISKFTIENKVLFKRLIEEYKADVCMFDSNRETPLFQLSKNKEINLIISYLKLN